MKRLTLVTLSLAAAAALAACGGNNNSDGSSDANVVPASASANVDGFIAYLKQVVASAADMLEPADTSMVVGPTDDTTEPVVVD